MNTRGLSLFAEAAPKLRVVGLFAGIGGIELGLGRAGHQSLGLCENDPVAREVLRKQMPEACADFFPEDVRRVRALPKGTSLVTAGFPCQDLSQAGLTLGIDGDRSGLVSHVFRLLRGQDVPNVLLENVPFMLQLGRGRALDVILRSLEQLDYRWAYRVLDTRAFGLPQRRERVFIFASRDLDPRSVLLSDDAGQPLASRVLNGHACGFYWTEGLRGLGWATDATPTLKSGSSVGIPSPPAIVLPNGCIVTPEIRDAERLQGFDVDWTKPAEGVAKRGSRWRLVGNAVSVPVAEWLGEKLTRPTPYDPRLDVELVGGRAWPRAAWGMRDARFSSSASAFPVKRPTPHLEDFLRFSAENRLSHRAAVGFLRRARASKSLVFPQGFLELVEKHRDGMAHNRKSAGSDVTSRDELQAIG